MAELSAASDKFDAWAAEPPTSSSQNARTGLAAGRPPIMAGKGKKGKVPASGSVRQNAHAKRIGLH